MSDLDFASYYHALDLEPGASDQEITRAKRALNELYHSDRLAHMSEAAQVIAAQKVRDANEAARVLLDPANRLRRDQWVGESTSVPRGAQRPSAPEPAAASTHERNQRVWRRPPNARLFIATLAVGGLAGATAFLLTHESPRARHEEARPPGPDTVARTAPAPGIPDHHDDAPRRAALRAVMDSVITVPANGRWTVPVVVGASFRASFLPEPDNVMYRVRTDGEREYVLNSEPGFRRISGDVRTYEFSSLTGQPFQVYYTRWPRSTPVGTAVHIRTFALHASGTWSQRIWLGSLGCHWEVDRGVAYEARDDEGRIIHVRPAVQSVAFGKQPAWLRFRSIDSLPLRLTVRYTVP